MTQIAVPVLAVERLEPFAGEHCVELGKGAGSFGVFVEGLARIHQVIDKTTERLRWVCGAFVGFVEH